MIISSDEVALAEQRGIKFQRDENNDILIKRVSLDEIHANTFDVKPKVNCRNLYEGRLETIKNTLETKGMGFDVIWGVKNDKTGKYCIVDGNHLQTMARKLNETHIRMLLFDANASVPSEAWALYCFSYDINKKSMYIAEKIEAVWYGYLYHKKREERYQDYLPIEFGEKEQTLKRYKTLYKRTIKLKRVNRDAFIKLINSSKINNWSEKEFRRQVISCEKRQLEEDENLFDDGEETTPTDGLVFQSISYIKNIGKRIKNGMSEERITVADINEDLNKLSANLDSLIKLQEEGDFPSRVTKNKLNTSLGAFRSTVNNYKKELKNKEESVELCLELYSKLKEFKSEMKCR